MEHPGSSPPRIPEEEATLDTPTTEDWNTSIHVAAWNDRISPSTIPTYVPSFVYISIKHLFINSLHCALNRPHPVPKPDPPTGNPALSVSDDSLHDAPTTHLPHGKLDSVFFVFCVSLVRREIIRPGIPIPMYCVFVFRAHRNVKSFNIGPSQSQTRYQIHVAAFICDRSS